MSTIFFLKPNDFRFWARDIVYWILNIFVFNRITKKSKFMVQTPVVSHYSFWEFSKTSHSRIYDKVIFIFNFLISILKQFYFGEPNLIIYILTQLKFWAWKECISWILSFGCIQDKNNYSREIVNPMLNAIQK